MTPSSIKVISEVTVGNETVGVRPPFKMGKDKQRRYIRLEISEPVECMVLKSRGGDFWPDLTGPAFRGSILNISAGGTLIVTEFPAEEKAVVLLKMSLQDVEVIDRVIGVIKRADADENEWLVGIEFISRENLADVFSGPELAMIPENVASFDEKIKKTLNKYVFFKKVAGDER